jgi:hypothetical protein
VDGEGGRHVSSESAGGDGTVQNGGHHGGPADELGEIGPVDVVLIEFPPGAPMTGEAVPIMLDLVERQIVHVLDVLFIRKGMDGSYSGFAARDLQAESVGDFEAFEGASSGLLADDDAATAADALEPGASAVLIVYENSWAGPFAAAIRRSGGRLIASERVSVRDLIEAIEATEAGTPQSKVNASILRSVTRSALGSGSARGVSRQIGDRQSGRWAAQHNGTNGHATAEPDRLD